MSDDKITTIKEFGERILSGVHADVDELPKVAVVHWNEMNFVHNEALPFDEFSLVIELFHEDDIVRVYTMPKAPPSNPPPKDWKPRHPTRYSLTKRGRDFVAETMSLTTMADEIANEWNQVALGLSSAEAERDAVVSYIETFGAEPINGVELAQEIRDEVHLEDDEDDDEETDSPDETNHTEPVSPTIPAPPGAPVMEAIKAS
jgi:hypothetical protein